ncbi:maleylacetoacetate isomerase [Noviherbaspirillum sp. Root189]|uniref:maleylacetoacetate isomerase n=1 Tax=Noviherbaspirillum sp. Root189 TaxID=1736487 RepID=UPI00070F6B2F|nr:maleylacetoacetate isomerase [Noviherbaspirillum sp. Root189]KRB72966.1 maleylacetoacetate isomerase [Noviherbaspirillum sp. Root189]
MNLYTYFRSSASFRVRIVLNLKNQAYQSIPVHMLRDGGEQHSPAYRGINPLGLVPALEIGEGAVLTQSIAICEFLEESYPEPRLLPADRFERAWVRSLCNVIACDIHPINNLRVLKYLTSELGHSEEEKIAWYRHWILTGLGAIEKMLGERASQYCLGDSVTMADAFLVPQVWNALRFECPLDQYPTIASVYKNAMALDAVKLAQPSAQPDAE